MIRNGRRIGGIGPVPLALLAVTGLALLAVALRPVDADAPDVTPVSPPLDLGRLAARETGAAVTRPLFDPDRRPWTAQGSRDDLTARERPQTLLTVRGILIEDRVRRALVADGSGEPVWLTPGEGRGAWRLVSIEASQVVVADAGRSYTLAFLSPPVALRPVPRHPAQDAPVLRPALSPAEAPTPPALRSGEATAPVRRIEIMQRGRP